MPCSAAGSTCQAAAIAAFLGRAVAIEGRKGDALAVHAPAAVPSAAAAVAAYLARPSSGVALRVGIAGAGRRPGRRAAGSSCSATSRRASSSGSPRSGSPGCSASSWHATRPSRGRARPAAAASRSPRTVRRGSSLLASQGGAVDEAADLAAREATRAELGLLFPHRQLVLRGSAESLELRVVAVAADDDRLGLGIAARLAEYLDRTVALSRPFHEPSASPGRRGRRPGDARGGGAPARTAVGRPRAHGCRRTSCWAACAACPTARARPGSCWRRSSSGGPSVQAERLATLRAVLGVGLARGGGDALGVHRNTIAYRVARLEQLAEWDLGDPDLRFSLALGGQTCARCTRLRTLSGTEPQPDRAGTVAETPWTARVCAPCTTRSAADRRPD